MATVRQDLLSPTGINVAIFTVNQGKDIHYFCTIYVVEREKCSQK